MSVDDPQTDSERDCAECFIIAVQYEPGTMWRPHGVTLGAVARDEYLATVREVADGRLYRAISLEAEGAAA